LLLIFAFGHTSGVLLIRDFGPEANAVENGMRSIPFQMMGSHLTFWDSYLGFGLLVSVLLLFSAVWAWQLAGISQQNPEAKRLAWTFFLCQAAVAVLCIMYFFVLPIVQSILIALCAGLAAWRWQMKVHTSATQEAGRVRAKSA